MQATKVNADYRSVLKAELLKRIKVNPAYSLRRFAAQLRLSPATLSGVLSGQRRLSLKAAIKISDRLNLAPSDATIFYQSVIADFTEDRKKQVTSQVAEYMILPEDVFQSVSNWYHYSILELTLIDGFRWDARLISKSLGINHAEAQDAMERLKKLGLVKKQNETYVKSSTNLATLSEVPSQAIRSRHKQILNKATQSIDTDPVNQRDFSSITMAIDPELIPEAKRKIARFRRSLCAFLESGKKRQVYELSVQLFPISKGEIK